MKAIRFTLGVSLLLLPFGAATGIMVATGGWLLPVIVWGAVAAICACIIGGIHLLNKAEGVY